MRIVAGTARGRSLAGPKATSQHIRPTADRVRETLFNMLGQFLDGQRVLDLYAGTGALGLEALSRGAGHLVMVDQDREAQSLCRQNAEHLGFTAQSTLLAQPVNRALELLARQGERFEIVFADPPYAARVVESVLESVAKVVAPGGTVVVEHDKREPAPEAHAGLTQEDQRRFGDTLVTFYRAPAESPETIA
ncbi:16S rRNA (guanine(966)-N(2))-methyltransferase RsmD [Corallococcus sp. H22C18031201]|uniref:16S rRNA (guanine(966)-N(2))-methyltransferase RsmD n=1 Tax=Citreicoccus inhibens TaxID=2849499 RepID=UPI000E719FF6|nr:16S rRNA (guanine(966)-N(2))-methyltransferase RsmD [Citreicoccus inhibens]MBU8897428.1 16S rRNA (guanine(966)-N(2))-methyltransferase RsmD [Citreicoccus inhibens]RJS16794.1 16S rRNA (guanine(966)-N(2))-methyltransferase RsmD [Corallococcus sp. H22C18031201]